MFARRLALPRNLQVPRGAFLAATRRPFSSTELPNGIKLAYDLYEPPEKKDSKSQDAPIVFIHGLFGSKKNNRSMSKYAPCQTHPLSKLRWRANSQAESLLAT